MLDLDYDEDSKAGCDGNFVLTADGAIVEAQVTAEGECYDEEGLLRLLRLARIGCADIFAAQLQGHRPVRPIGDRLVIATHNPGKLREIAALVAPLGIECVGADELGLPEPEEIGVTFADNADLKARAAADLSRPARARRRQRPVRRRAPRPPGIFSARWAEDEDGNRDWMRAMERVWREVEAAEPERPRRPFRLRAGDRLAQRRPDRDASKAASTARSSGRRAATRASATIRCSCRSATSRRSARWTRTLKHAISHRADAFRKLVAALNE